METLNLILLTCTDEGFTEDFFVIPKSPGFETRHNLYLLFHNLNHWFVEKYIIIIKNFAEYSSVFLGIT